MRDRGGRGRGLLGAVVVACALLPLPPAGAGEDAPHVGAAGVFASLPAARHPEGVLVSGRTVWVSTTVGADGPAVGNGQPSKLYLFDRRGGWLLREVTVEGEDTAAFHGIAGLAEGPDGHVYAADVQQGVLRLAPDGSRQELHVGLPDLRRCLPVPLPTGGPCSPTTDDRPPLANDLAFDPAGNLYVTDSWQAVVWRVPAGSRTPEVWLADPRFEGAFGVNGAETTPDGRALLLTVTGDLRDVARLYTVPLVRRPAPGDLRALAAWSSGGADGVVVGRSGRVYVTLFARDEIAVLDAGGRQVATLTSDLYDEPASLAFDDTTRSLLVPQHAFLNAVPERRRVVRVYVDDRAAADDDDSSR